MANSYITLTSDDDPFTIGGKYVAVMADPGMSRNLMKSTSKERTVGGKLDVGMGGVYQAWAYMFRVRESEPDTEYGDMDSLIALFSLNNPGGTPSNKLKLTDHYGNNHNVYMLDDIPIKPMTVIIAGVNAYYLIPVILTVEPEVA